MNRNFSFRIHPLLAAVIVVAALFVMLGGAYALTRSASDGEVMGRVQVAGVSIGGLTEAEALGEIRALEEEYLEREIGFSIDASPVSLDPREAGFDIAEEEIVDEALRIGRQGNGVYQFIWWLRHIFSTEQLRLVGSADEEALHEIFDRWESEVIAMPPSLGAVVLEDGAPQPVYPATGLGLDREASASIINESLLEANPGNDDLPTETIVPRLTRQDIDEAVAEAVELLSEPIRLVYAGEEVVFTPDQLTAAYRSETIAEGTPQIVHSFDPEIIDGYLEPIRANYEAEPVSAEFLITGDAIEIIPGKRGTRIDEDLAAQKLLQAGGTTGRVGQLPIVEDADPEVTTEELEALGIEHLVSSFTTYHSCCEDRVINIQTMADTIDEHIVMPGEEFSINGFVGQRTEEKGYVPAGTIIAGELVDTVGGGVSQFATTMYNAVFWGGYEDITHSPHSYYFSRYPEGIEATVNWRTPELIWRNNTDQAVMIDTQHTGTSITVRIFGDNDGRIVKGEQSGGSTKINVVSQGGPDAHWIEGEVSDRFAFRDPGQPLYRANPELGVDQQNQTQSEREGWSVNVVRRIRRGGTELIEEQEWLVTYRPRFAVIEVHPCKVPGTSVTCPTTTTTTTTTTIPTTTTTTTTTTTETASSTNGEDG